MKKQETEAALMALAQRIEWSVDGQDKDTWVGKVDGTRVYGIVCRKGRRENEPDIFELLYFTNPIRVAGKKNYPAYYSSRDDAQKATQHHVVTGKWKKALALVFPQDPEDPEAEKANRKLLFIDWERGSLRSWYGTAGGGPCEDPSEYEVYWEGDAESSQWRAEYKGWHSSLCPKSFPNSTQAKLACERHYQTLDDGSKGKWK